MYGSSQKHNAEKNGAAIESILCSILYNTKGAKVTYAIIKLIIIVGRPCREGEGRNREGRELPEYE